MIGCGRLPGRKRPALWIESGGVLRVLGYFQSDEAMKEFLTWSPMVTPPAHALTKEVRHEDR